MNAIAQIVAGAGGQSLTRRLIELIGASASGMSTTALRRATGIDGKRIRGMLKAPSSRGEVLYRNRLWTMNPQYVDPQTQRVVDALRAAGWAIVEPWNLKESA